MLTNLQEPQPASDVIIVQYHSSHYNIRMTCTQIWEAVPIPTSAIPTTRPIMRNMITSVSFEFDREFPPIRRYTPDSADCGRVRLRVRVRVRVRELSE